MFPLEQSGQPLPKQEHEAGTLDQVPSSWLDLGPALLRLRLGLSSGEAGV